MMNETTAGGRDPRIGTVLDRRYRIDQVVGIGGTGVVYGAWHLHLERPVAIKVLHARYAERAEHVERFRLEAQVMGMVGHDNVVSVLDFRYAADGIPYIVMELIEGETLRDRIRRAPLSIVEVAELFPSMCEGLLLAHERGIVHCDLKPDNLMLQRGEKGELLKILDFGTSRLTSLGSAGGDSAEEAGTAHYAAPERLQEGAPAPDHRVDIFALGAILYECLTGQMAFGGGTRIEAAYRVLSEPLPALRLPDGRAPGPLDAVLQRACHKDPRARFGSVKELAEALVHATAQAGHLVSGAFSAAISRSQLTSQPLAVPRPPMVPHLLSESKPTGAGVKPAVPMAIAQQIMAAVGPEPILARLGPEWLPRLQALAMTDWVDGVELQRILSCAHDVLGGEEALRKLGHTFAAVALTTTYRALLAEGEPEYVVRRTQVMLRLWYSEGESSSKEIAPGQWRLQIAGLRCMDGGVAAGTAGFIEGYLTMAGVKAMAVSYEEKDPAQPIWEFNVSFERLPE